MHEPPREIRLDVCPECGQVGKHVSGHYKGWCLGGRGQNRHKKARMVPTLFREVREAAHA